MRLVITADYEAMSDWAADFVATRILAAGTEKPLVLGLPTGSTPQGLYSRLVARHRAGSLSFAHVSTFNMDEYVGLPPDHEQSYRATMQRLLFDHVDIDPARTELPNGMAVDLAAECTRYEAAIAAAGGIDLFVGGIGGDGHLAFNEPGSSLASRTRIETLTHDTREANARFFDGRIEAVPRTALTVGLATLLDARELLILVSGRSKARALRQAVEGAVSQQWPCSCLQLHPQVVVVCDEAATEELRVGTLRHYKEREAGRD